MLEALVRKDFLPRGTGVVTRSPLQLRLRSVPTVAQRPDCSDMPSVDEWATFQHIPGKIFTDFGAVRQEIAAQTARLAGSNKGISSTPIVLSVFSPHVLNLTLVDLPGITRNAVGDQPQDIELRVTQLVRDHIAPKNTIILVRCASELRGCAVAATAMMISGPVALTSLSRSCRPYRPPTPTWPTPAR